MLSTDRFLFWKCCESFAATIMRTKKINIFNIFKNQPKQLPSKNNQPLKNNPTLKNNNQ